MKRLMPFVLTFVCLVLSSNADIIYPDGHRPEPEDPAWRKLTDGFANIIAAPIELVKAAIDAGRDYGILDFRQITSPIFEGSGRMFKRLLTGVDSIFTAGDDTPPLYHLDPDVLNLGHIIPGYMDQFPWESVGGATGRFTY